MTPRKCKCGVFPIVANGYRVTDELWVVVICCREPEKHSAGDKYTVVAFNKSSLEDAEEEAEKIWDEITEAPRKLS